MRKIILYSTKGGKKEITSDAKTWGELRPEVEMSYDLANLQATENINKTTLVNKEAVLPDGNFIIFLRPIETKGGNQSSDDLSNMSFFELRTLIKQECYEGIKDFLNQFKQGKNYTQLNKEELREGVILYFEKDTVEDEEKKVSFKDEIDNLNEMLDYFNFIYDNINKPLNNSSKELIEVIKSDITELTNNLYDLESVEEKDEELEELEKEYKEIEKGFFGS